ncbi:transposable element Tcb1 transposase [Trichonephila clavipes]|nr:transposable element Tcb1 transposase [Trichonephila clavipes]
MQITLYSSSKRAFNTNGEARRRWSYGVGVLGEQWYCQVGVYRERELIMIKYDYLDVLKKCKGKCHQTCPWIISLPTRHDPKHTAEIVKLWLLYYVPNQLHTPPRSPDLNLVEHRWDFLERKIRQHNISSKDMLKSVLKDEWEKKSAEETTKLVSSMSKRLQEVLKRQGYPTRY